MSLLAHEHIRCCSGPRAGQVGMTGVLGDKQRERKEAEQLFVGTKQYHLRILFVVDGPFIHQDPPPFNRVLQQNNTQPNFLLSCCNCLVATGTAKLSISENIRLFVLFKHTLLNLICPLTCK